jgi:hypothetical protein
VQEPAGSRLEMATFKKHSCQEKVSISLIFEPESDFTNVLENPSKYDVNGRLTARRESCNSPRQTILPVPEQPVL